MSTSPTPVRCDGCDRECFDHSSVDGQRLCLLCVTDQLARLRELQAGQVAVLQSLIDLCREHGWIAGELTLLDWLRSRLAASAANTHTLEHVELVCALLGYDPDAGQPVTEWIANRLRDPEAAR